MSALALTALNLLAQSAWAILGKLLTQTFMTNLLTKLVIAGLEKLAARSNSPIDDSIVADVKKALEQ